MSTRTWKKRENKEQIRRENFIYETVLIFFNFFSVFQEFSFAYHRLGWAIGSRRKGTQFRVLKLYFASFAVPVLWSRTSQWSKRIRRWYQDETFCLPLPTPTLSTASSAIRYLSVTDPSPAMKQPQPNRPKRLIKMNATLVVLLQTSFL